MSDRENMGHDWWEYFKDDLRHADDDRLVASVVEEDISRVVCYEQVFYGDCDVREGELSHRDTISRDMLL